MASTPFACESYAEDLSALIDGELSSQREAIVRDHLSACADCSQIFEALRGVDEVLAAVAMPEVPARLRLRLDAEIESSSERQAATRLRSAPPSARGKFIRPAVAAALALAASVAVYWAVVPQPPLVPDSEVTLVVVAEENRLVLEPESRSEEIAVADPPAIQDLLEIEQPVATQEPVTVQVEEAAPALESEPRAYEVAIADPLQTQEAVTQPVEETEWVVEREPRIEEVAIVDPLETQEPLETERPLEVQQPPETEQPLESQEPVLVADGAFELEAASDEDLAMLLQFETVQDLEVISNLEMLERLMAVGEGTS